MMVLNTSTNEGGGIALPTDKEAKGQRLYSVSELSRELGITPRSMRFYEDKGLIVPSRVGTTRVYSMRDRARMKLIIRGKQLGFTLKEIKEYLDLYDADPKHKAQKQLLLKQVQKRMRDLHSMSAAIAATLSDLENLQQSLLEPIDTDVA